MATPPITPNPQMHGITPAPLEMPAQRRSDQKEKSNRPLLISLLACYLYVRGVVFLLVGMTVWGRPDSSLWDYLLPHARFVFSSLPWIFLPLQFAAMVSEEAMLSILPVALLLGSLYSFIGGGLVWGLNYWVRWICMFMSGATVAKTVIAISGTMVGPSLVPITDELKLGLYVNVAVNLLVFCYFAFYPGVKEAFESNK
ncbi:MAG: hypothetical protein ABSD44_10430 [Terracidiphilus sp.]